MSSGLRRALRLCLRQAYANDTPSAERSANANVYGFAVCSANAQRLEEKERV